MKKEFAHQWKSSKKIRKQRKYRYKAPLHVRHKFLSSNLSKDLRKKYNIRSLFLRKGDSIKVMRGEFKDKKGKIGDVDTRNLRVYIEGIQKNKKDGTKVSIPFQPSNLQITDLNLEDKKRTDILERKKAKQKPVEKKVEEKKK